MPAKGRRCRRQNCRSRVVVGAGGPDQDARLAAFGPNEWLVDEIYQQYLTDQSSVDPAWWDFFADYVPTEHAGADLVAASAAARAAAKAEAEAAELASDAEIAAHAAPAAAGRAACRGPAGRPRRRPWRPPPRPPHRPRPSRRRADADQRGAAARVVANMEASLSVPTATSVRAVPAKLLIDNRIVINNHLARGRGGKVSFTHLIGYAARAGAGRPCRR